MRKVYWGIVGLGNIAHSFVKDLMLIKEAKLVSVASRSLENSKRFAEKYQVEHYYSSYDALFKDEKVDIVYVATTNESHAELTIKALEHGKHVLCEKPVALNLEQAKKMVNASRSNKKFFMEAFWTRFNPSIQEVYRKVKNEEIGEIRYINADFAFRTEAPKNRLTEKNLGGGSLLDIGVYPLFLSYLILGKPEKVMASAQFYDSGVDKQCSIILSYKNAQSVLHSSFETWSNMLATVGGTTGRINIHPVWHETQGYSLIRNNQKVAFNLPTFGKGFTGEILECHTCILQGDLESKKWSHQNSLDLIELVDRVKKEIGLSF